MCLGSRDVVGDCSILGDLRWAGAWGINADFAARTACSVMSIATADILVRCTFDGNRITRCKAGEWGAKVARLRSGML